MRPFKRANRELRLQISRAVQLQHRTAEARLRIFETLVLGGCIDKTGEGYDGTCIEGSKSRAEVEFFTIYRKLIGGGFEIVTGRSDFYEAQRVAAHLCGRIDPQDRM